MRYTRHELKQDKFAASAAEAVHEVVEHRTGIVRIAAVVVAVGLVIGGLSWYREHREEQAGNALGQALVAYDAPVVPPNTPQQGGMLSFHSDQERLIAAKNQFHAISAQYGSTRSGEYARYLAAVTEQQLGNNAVAEENLRALSDSRNRELASLAKYALVSLYQQEKRSSDAMKLLQELIDKPTDSVPKVNAQLALADLYGAQHQPDKAKVILDQIVKENPKNSLGQIAKSRQGQP